LGANGDKIQSRLGIIIFFQPNGSAVVDVRIVFYHFDLSLFPSSKAGRPPKYDLREIMNALFTLSIPDVSGE